jgi:hypothetical protein
MSDASEWVFDVIFKRCFNRELLESMALQFARDIIQPAAECDNESPPQRIFAFAVMT